MAKMLKLKRPTDAGAPGAGDGDTPGEPADEMREDASEPSDASPEGTKEDVGEAPSEEPAVEGSDDPLDDSEEEMKDEPPQEPPGDDPEGTVAMDTDTGDPGDPLDEPTEEMAGDASDEPSGDNSEDRSGEVSKTPLVKKVILKKPVAPEGSDEAGEPLTEDVEAGKSDDAMEAELGEETEALEKELEGELLEEVDEVEEDGILARLKERILDEGFTKEQWKELKDIFDDYMPIPDELRT